ncbi:hypothetical protein [Luteolibacter marinus]|uniref:hypothetical protein n=1 Tax=Luteolibacter marinus TaxID=2776705 RepID=UPI00186793E6|nr:hypothetical protein [Luteolibacter marinus]
MSHSLFQDDRAAGLLSRVREDIGHLRQDVRNLVRHTTRHTLPDGARGLAGSARDQLVAGRSYAASQFRSLRESPQRQAIGVIGGALLVGAIAAGIYIICKSDCCAAASADDEALDELENEVPE